MQWTLQELNSWEELRPYVDSALLPLYLFRQDRDITEHIYKTTYLANLGAAIERRLRGRVLLFPLSYQTEAESNRFEVPAGFSHYFVLRFAQDRWDLRYNPDVSRLYTLPVGEEELDSEVRFQVTADLLVKEIGACWRADREGSGK